jgi:hypothetical protein
MGSRSSAYRVWIRVRELTGAEWEALLDLVSSEVGFAAALLDGELPPELVDLARAAGLDLLPGPGDLTPNCSCPDWADPCKHAAAVCYLVGDVLDADPMALLLLRGRSSEEVMAGLRSRRSDSSPASAPPTALDASSDRGVPAAALYRRHAGLADPDPALPDPALPDPAPTTLAPHRPALPTPPLPPAHPGRPAALVADPPPSSGLTAAALTALAADAARRAHALALGSGEADAALGLDLAADRARRAAELIDAPAGASGLTIDALARAAGISNRQLQREALAWIQGGVPALDALEGSWNPDPSELDEARAALGPGAKVWRNRITAGDRQIRIGRDGRWYPYRRSGESWDPQGTPL